MKQAKTIAELKEIARRDLSHAYGQDAYTGDNDYYTGNADGLVKFDGEPIGQSGRIFQLTITNANAAVRTVLLCPGLLLTAAGKMATGAFNDKGGAAGLTGAGITSDIERFIEYFRRNACKINVIQVQSDQEVQLNYAMKLYQDSPFEQLNSKNIPMSAFQTTQDTKKMVIVPTHKYGLQFDDQTILELPIAGSSSCTITIYVGGDANPARALAIASKTLVAATAVAKA